ncbi:hypothetical protein Tco_1577072 [Tanacetum coccineum]
MAESSSHNPPSSEITPKEEHATFDKPGSPNPFLHADQVEFSFEEIALTTNNEVSLLYPSHLNSEYFKVMSDFISKCCLKEAFTRAPTQYKEYLCEFWFISLLLEYMMPEYDNEELTINPTKAIYNIDVLVDSQAPKTSSQTKNVPQAKKPGAKNKQTQSSSTKDKSSSHPSPSTSVVGEMHKEAQQAAGGPTSLRATSEEGSHPQLSSGSDFLVPQLKLILEFLLLMNPYLNNMDLSDLMKDTRSSFFTPDSPQDEPIIILDENEEEETEKDEDTHTTSHDVLEDTSVPHPPSPKSAQIQELMAQLGPHIQISTSLLNFCSGKAQDFGFPSKSIEQGYYTLNKFSIVVETASGAASKNVPSVGQATASPAEGEKNTNTATRDAEQTNLHNELVDLLDIDIMTQYYNKKLLYDKYYDKMLKRRKSSKIINCDVLTQKGPITLMEYLNQTEKELKINFNKPLKEQDPLNELNDLANKKRKRTSDSKDHSRSSKKHKSLVQHEEEVH